jgi:hypothetical protein
VFTSYGGVQVTNHFSMPFPLAQMATWDKREDLESARALRSLDPAVLLVGHVPAVRNPGSAIDSAIGRAEAALS